VQVGEEVVCQRHLLAIKWEDTWDFHMSVTALSKEVAEVPVSGRQHRKTNPAVTNGLRQIQNWHREVQINVAILLILEEIKNVVENIFLLSL
jgi:hypothetical protein